MRPKAKQFEEKINTTKSSFLSALDDFKKYYVFYHKNPEVDEYSNHFVNSKGQLQTLSGEMFTTTNIIQKNIEDLNEIMTDISEKLTKEKELYQRLEKMAASLNSTESGSNILISDAKKEYSINYYKNFSLFVGILFILGLLFSFKISIILIIIAFIYVYYTGLFNNFLPLISHV